MKNKIMFLLFFSATIFLNQEVCYAGRVPKQAENTQIQPYKKKRLQHKKSKRLRKQKKQELASSILYILSILIILGGLVLFILGLIIHIPWMIIIGIICFWVPFTIFLTIGLILLIGFSTMGALE